MPLTEQEIILLNRINPISLKYAEKLTLLDRFSEALTLLDLTLALTVELGGSSVKQLEAQFGQNESFGRFSQKTYEGIASLVSNSKLINQSKEEHCSALIELLGMIRQS